MLLNIPDNATKYVPSGGTVKIIAKLNNRGLSKSAVILIEDNGPGISDDLKDAVFTRFYRVDKARTRLTGGNGLGLPIARSIVEAHGGSITLTDSELGGCLFTVPLLVENLDKNDK